MALGVQASEPCESEGKALAGEGEELASQESQLHQGKELSWELQRTPRDLPRAQKWTLSPPLHQEPED